MVLSGVRTESLPDGRHRLTKPYGVAIGYGDSQWWIAVPAGFVTDGASIPRGLWWLFGPPMRAKYFPAAVVHDYLCVESYKHNSYEMRAMADVAFLWLLRDCGVGRVKRSLMFLAVRNWGRFTYRGEQ